MRHLSCDPQIETVGINALAFTNNLRGEDVAPVMEKYGLAHLGPDDWYQTQKFLDVLNELGTHAEFASGLVAIGMAIGKVVPVEGTPSLADVLTAWDGIYQGLHRGGDVGHLKCEKIDAKHYKMTFTDLYPDDFSYGIMYGYAQRFLPSGTDFTIAYDTEVKARDHGGQEGKTVIHAKWE